MMSPWRATCIQMDSEIVAFAGGRDAAWHGIARNLDAGSAAIAELFRPGNDAPRLVVLPEFAFQGPPHDLTVAEWMAMACCDVPGPITAPLQRLAQERRLYIGGNQFETDPRWPGRFFNCSFLIDPRGEVILKFRRINTAMWPSPHDLMDDYLAAYGMRGTFPVVATELGRLAMIPCGEIAVPEVARVMMIHGAEVILHPTNEPITAGQEAAKVARAAENMVYLVSANVAGGIGFSCDGGVRGGHSQIIDFTGERLAHTSTAEATSSVSALIDLDALRAARQDRSLRNTLLRLRFEMYRDTYAHASFYPPNAFREAPMRNAAALEEPVQRALANLREQGIG